MTETKKAWGTLLHAHPFEQKPWIDITIEVVKPKPKHKATLRAYFRGVQIGDALGRYDIAAWMNCLHVMLARADQIVAEYAKPSRKKK